MLGKRATGGVYPRIRKRYVDSEYIHTGSLVIFVICRVDGMLTLIAAVSPRVGRLSPWLRMPRNALSSRQTRMRSARPRQRGYISLSGYFCPELSNGYYRTIPEYWLDRLPVVSGRPKRAILL